MRGWRGSTPQNKLYALGRLKSGAMNATEKRYAAHLDILKYAGEVLWWKFEGMKLRLADNTFLTVDFAVMMKNGILEMHEVKGYMMDDANVKIKVASELYPFKFVLIKAASKRDGGGWKCDEY